MIHPRRGGTGMSWTRLLSLSSWYFSFWAIASQPRRPTRSPPTATCAPPSTSILREKVIDWWVLVIRMGFIARASSGRSAKPARR
jgi:hypothetical protein